MAAAPLSIALVRDTGTSSTDRITSYPVVKGVGQPNTLVIIKEGGATLGIALTDGTGAWSFIPPGLADGAHTLSASQTASDGSIATATLSFTLDRAAPVVSVALFADTGGSSTDRITSNPTVKGVGQANTLVTIKEGGVTLGTAMADGTGAWNFTPVGLADGAHVFSVSQTDLAGNTGTATLSFTLDRAAPVVSMALLSDDGSSSTDKITSNPAVKGVGQANTPVTIKEGGVTLGTAMADGTGAWNFTPVGLADGAHVFSVSQTDLAGNTGTATLSFTLDSSQGSSPPPPALSIALISDTGSSSTDRITSDPTVKGVGQANTLVTITEGGVTLGTANVTSKLAIKGTGQANTLVTITEGGVTLGTAMADGTGAWNFTPVGLADGAHVFSVSQTDLAGNTGTATLSFTLDRAAPVVSMALLSDDGSSSTDKITSNPAVKGVGQANTPVTIKEGGVTLGTAMADGTGAWNFTPVGLADGAHVFSVSQTDLAGNTGTATLSFTLDSSQGSSPPPPALSIALISDTGSSSTDNVTSKLAIKGTGQANSVVTIKEGGVSLGTTMADGTGAWSFIPPGLADGVHTVIASQTDRAGNTGTATLTFTLDRIAPALSMALLSDDGSSSSDRITSNPTIKGFGDANTLVTIKEAGTILGTATSDGAGAWSFTPPDIAVGVHTLTTTQTDLAGNTGTSTLSFTLTAPQPSQSGDIVGLLLQNTGATAEQSGYVTFGQVFKPGAIMPGESLVARIAGVDYAVQMDVKATNSDGSVRHAVLTLSAPGIALGGSLALMLAKGSAAMPSPAAPSAASLLASGYNLDVAFTFRNADGTTTTDNASAAAALQAAITAGNVQRWLTGPEVNEYSVVTTVNGGKLKVEFDIRAYADGTTSTDVIFDNSWMFSPGKSDLTYDVAIRQGGTQVYSANNVSQYLYSLWDHRVDSAGTINPNVQYDVSYLTAAAALPTYDQSYGVSISAIQTDYNKLNPSSSSGYGSTGPMGTAEVQPYMPATAGRPDIGPQPNWVAQWVLSQTSTAEALMMANANASGSVPWHLVDENSGKQINSDDYPRFYEDPNNNTPGNPYWSPQPVNGWPTYGKNGEPWSPDTAHIPDLNYVPYLTTGSHYQLRLLQAAANFVDLNMPPDSKYNGNPGPSPGIPGSNIYLGLASWHNQARGIAWSVRQIAEAAFLTPDGDPQKAHFVKLLNDTMSGLVQYYVTGGYNSKFGEIQGFLMGYGDQYANEIRPWMQDYIVTAFAEIAGMNIPTASNNAIQMLRYMDNFISGVYTHRSDGFNPYNGPAYSLKNADPITNAPITTWAQLAQVNSTDYPLDATSLTHSSYPSDVQGYAVNARTALADLITYTQSTNAIEAYGFITGQIALAWGHNPAGMVAAYQGFPSWDVVPRLPDGEYLQANQMQIDVSNNPSVTLNANGRDSLLSVVGTGTATLTGGTGGTDLLFGGAGPTTLIAGTGNDYLFAGNGATTFIDNNGNDYMKGGPGTDTFHVYRRTPRT